jgi:hypothetical protein
MDYVGDDRMKNMLNETIQNLNRFDEQQKQDLFEILERFNREGWTIDDSVAQLMGRGLCFSYLFNTSVDEK